MKKKISQITNIIIFLVLAYVLYLRVPTIINSYRLQNSKIEITTIHRISGEEISIPDVNKNKIVVFWATWCPACRAELKKLNQMISQGLLQGDDLIAISVDENRDEIISFIKKEEYQFLVAHDQDGVLSKKFNISATPTILFVNKNGNLDWVGTGVSPLLEKRVREYFGSNKSVVPVN